MAYINKYGDVYSRYNSGFPDAVWVDDSILSERNTRKHTMRVYDVVKRTMEVMDDYYYWLDAETFGPPGPPVRPTVPEIVKILKKEDKTVTKKKTKTAETIVDHQIMGRMTIEVEEADKPKELTAGDLELGETFSYPSGYRGDNVYMVIAPKDSVLTYKSHADVSAVLLRTGIIYELSPYTVVRRRPCHLKVAA